MPSSASGSSRAGHAGSGGVPRLRPLAGHAYTAWSRETQLLLRAARLDHDGVRAARDARLRGLLAHAARGSAGWRHRLATAGVVVDGQVDLARFSALPPLTRDELAADPARFTLDDLTGRRTYTNTSGGSTGEPVTLVQDRGYLRWARAVKTVFDAFTGYVPGQPKLVVWGASRDTQRHPPLSTRLRHWAKNETWVDAYRLTPQAMRDWAKLTHQLRPVQILGYAESLAAWAAFLLEHDIEVRRPNAVLSTAGVLTAPMRATITAALQAPVFDRYGSREVSDVACETSRHDGLAVAPLHAYVEVVDDHGQLCPPGVDGEVLVTSLTNGAMPLVRYRLGDRAAWAASPTATTPAAPAGAAPSIAASSGVSANRLPLVPNAWPRLAQVTGRVTDHFVAADGARVYAGALRTGLYGLRGIRAYQLVQHTPARVEVRLVAAPDAPRELANQVGDRLRAPLAALLGGAVDLEVVEVDEIAVSPTGKHRHTICLVATTPNA